MFLAAETVRPYRRGQMVDDFETTKFAGYVQRFGPEI